MPPKPKTQWNWHTSPVRTTESKYAHVELPPAPELDKYAPRGYLTVKPRREATVLRPGALDHEKYGDLQADGSVKPFTPRLLAASTRINPGLNTASWVEPKPSKQL